MKEKDRTENMEKRDSIVNEEYEEKESSACCCAERDTFQAGSGSECSCSNGMQADHVCECEKDPELELLEKKLKEAEEKQEEYLKMAQRVQADFDNYKRRNRNARAEAHQAAAAEVVEAFLPVLDNLDRAMESISASNVDESVIKGIELVRKQFLDTLSRLDVEEIDALGKPFDPELHNAVGQVEAEEGQEENTVALVLQKGYRMGGRVIRYSMVHVAR
ncbi:MAG: nucleotide exchange factor GrpE [Caldicoprobacterales bacterium]|nr:nucleotide exchange factor GrpE [Clostridiales bacterium]